MVDVEEIDADRLVSDAGLARRGRSKLAIFDPKGFETAGLVDADRLAHWLRLFCLRRACAKMLKLSTSTEKAMAE